MHGISSRTGQAKDGRTVCFKPIAFCCSRCHCRLNLLHLSIKIRFFYRDVVIGHKYMLKYSDHCSSHNPTNMTANRLL